MKLQKNKKSFKKKQTFDIVLQRKRSYIIDTRCRGHGETYNLSQKLAELGLEVHTVLNKSAVIFGRCTDEVRDIIKLNPFVKHVEFDE